MSLLRSALDCATRGWRVVPLHGVDGQGNCSCGNACGKAGKHPRIRRWREAATTREDQVRSWWATWPDSNVGVVTGAASGLVVLDIDPGRGGEDTLAGIESEHGRLPATVESITGTGGRHIWLAHPGGDIGGGSKLGPGVDVCADGQLVVAPGSRHRSGHTYVWELSSHPDDVEVQPMPQALMRLVRAPAPKAKKHPGADLFPGERNSTLTSMAGFAVMGGFAPSAVRAALHEHNRVCCKPPLPVSEVEDIARSAARWAAPPLWTSRERDFLSDPALGAKDRMVLVALTSHAKPDGTCHPGYRAIAKVSGVSKSQVGKHIDRLRRAGRIEVDRSGRFNRYRIVNALPDDCVRPTLVVQSQQAGQRGSARVTAAALAEVAA